MYYLYHGEDTYMIKEKVDRQIERFIEAEKTDLNLTIIDAKELTFPAYKNAVFSMPFLGQKRLTIINGLLSLGDKDLQDKVKESLESIPTFCTVLFVEKAKFDKRLSLFKTLNSKKTSFVFDSLSGYDINRKIEEMVSREHFLISKEAVNLLALSVGSDLWRYKNEILKLINYAKSTGKDKITKDEIDDLVPSAESFRIFDLTDAISQKDLVKSLKVLTSLIGKKEDPLMIFGMIVSNFRTLAIVFSLRDKKESEIVSMTKLHPFVVKKTLSVARNYDFSTIIKCYRLLTSFDYCIKTGLIDASLALNLLVVDFCKK